MGPGSHGGTTVRRERAGCTVGKGLSGLRNENQCMTDQESCMKEKLRYVEKLSIVELGCFLRDPRLILKSRGTGWLIATDSVAIM